MGKNVIAGKDLNRICRLCLSERRVLVDLFSFSSKFNAEISDVVMKCTSIHIIKHNQLSNFVCKLCLIQLEKSCKFQNQVEQSEKVLLDYLKEVKHQNISKNIVCGSFNSRTKYNEDDSLVNRQDKSFKIEEQDNFKSVSIEIKDEDYVLESEVIDLEENSKTAINHEKYSNDSNLKQNNSKHECTEIKDSYELEQKSSESNETKHLNYESKRIEIKEENANLKQNNSKHECTEIKDSYELEQKSSESNETKHLNYESKRIVIKEENVNLKQKCTDSEVGDNEIKQSIVKTKLHSCETCNKSFKYLKKLKIHHNIHTGEKPYKCEICNRSFNDPSNFRKHKQNHINKSLNLRRTKFQCDICGQCFTDSSGLKYHTLKHTGERPHRCEVCDKTFRTLVMLKVHILYHTGEKPHKCDICDARFAQQSGLNSHILSHTDKLYQCNFCDRKFNQLCNLKAHKRQHTGDRPYRCDICWKCFVRSTTLKRHKQQVHTGERPYLCDICNKGFVESFYLKKHEKTHFYQT